MIILMHFEYTSSTSSLPVYIRYQSSNLYLYIYLFIYLPIYLSHPSISLSHLSIYPSIYHIHLSITSLYLSITSIYPLSIYPLSIYLSIIYLSITSIYLSHLSFYHIYLSHLSIYHIHPSIYHIYLSIYLTFILVSGTTSCLESASITSGSGYLVRRNVSSNIITWACANTVNQSGNYVYLWFKYWMKALAYPDPQKRVEREREGNRKRGIQGEMERIIQGWLIRKVFPRVAKIRLFQRGLLS